MNICFNIAPLFIITCTCIWYSILTNISVPFVATGINKLNDGIPIELGKLSKKLKDLRLGKCVFDFHVYLLVSCKNRYLFMLICASSHTNNLYQCVLCNYLNHMMEPALIL